MSAASDHFAHPVVIRNEPNSCLTRFGCSLCGGSTEKQEYLFQLTDEGGGIVCDGCAEHPEEIPARIRHRITHLQERIAQLEHDARHTYVTEVARVPDDWREAQGGMYAEDGYPQWMRDRLDLPTLAREKYVPDDGPYDPDGWGPAYKKTGRCVNCDEPVRPEPDSDGDK